MDRFLQEVSPCNDLAIQALEGIRSDPPPISTASEDIWRSWATMHMERIQHYQLVVQGATMPPEALRVIQVHVARFQDAITANWGEWALTSAGPSTLVPASHPPALSVSLPPIPFVAVSPLPEETLVPAMPDPPCSSPPPLPPTVAKDPFNRSKSFVLPHTPSRVLPPPPSPPPISSPTAANPASPETVLSGKDTEDEDSASPAFSLLFIPAPLPSSLPRANWDRLVASRHMAHWLQVQQGRNGPQ
ncbi:hypothetical protein AX14_004141, partial [Amanita brunnescens Koide BX004]